MKETDAIDEYILQHIDEESDYLKALYRDTHVKLLRPRMASGHLQGRMLKMFVQMIRPRQVLEIGTYSGYSALCLAEGLEEGATLHTFEINDEQEDFTRPWLEGSMNTILHCSIPGRLLITKHVPLFIVKFLPFSRQMINTKSLSSSRVSPSLRSFLFSLCSTI